MHQIRQLLQLCQQGLSIRQITARLGMSRNTIRHYLRRADASGRSIADLLNATDAELDACLEPALPPAEPIRQTAVLERLPAIHQQVQQGVTLYQLWLEYRQVHPDGYQYTQFGVYYRRWCQRLQASLHLEHKAGDKLFVDFAGKRLHLTDAVTGQQTPVEIFVAILGHTQLTYVQAVVSQQTDHFLLALEGALRFIGGVPAAIVPDNLKAAVRQANRYEPKINPALADFALHYGTTILPTRVGKPKDKALVEGAVRILYQRVYASLRQQTFTSLAQLNEALWQAVEVHNQTRFQRQPFSRRQAFEDYERAVLGSLPTEAFVRKAYRWARVQKNYHVLLSDDNQYYSVPYRLIGQRVQLVYSVQTLEVYHHYERVAVHERHKGAAPYVTQRHHLPEAHRQVLDYNPDYFRTWANRIGPQTRAVIDRLLAERKHPEQINRSCLGILRLGLKLTDERLERACGRALTYNTVSYSVIANILQRGLDQTLPTPVVTTAPPVHDNIRGATAYQ